VRNPVYAEHVDVNSCGDWLAVGLKDAFRTDGGFDLTAFKTCLKENGVELPKVDMERHGARFRLCAGLMLRRHALKVGHVVIGGKKIAAPGAKNSGRKTMETGT